MEQVVLFRGWYSKALCLACPEFLFVFGDNLLGFGMGGQAIIRTQPNAFGIPTKRKPSMSAGSFFSEHSESDLDAVLRRIGALWECLNDGITVVVPVNEKGETTLGLERAKLREKAPTIYNAIQKHIEEMCDGFGSIEIDSEKGLRWHHAHSVGRS